MDFVLTPVQVAVQEKARRLAREGQFPQEVLELWAREGMFGLALPQELGGRGLDNDIMRLIIARDLLK